MHYQSKGDLLSAVRDEYDRLLALLTETSPEERDTVGIWGDGWTLKDLVAHLSAWHGMFLRWHEHGLAGRVPDMPAPGYKWNETPKLNRDLWARHRDRSWDEVRDEFQRTHGEIVELVQDLSEEELLEPGHFEWTGKNPLTTYLGANTASHYRFAIKVIRRWRRRSRRQDSPDTI